MNFICLKTTENSLHELDIMGAYPRKHSTRCEKKGDKDAVLESGGHEGVILIKSQTYNVQTILQPTFQIRKQNSDDKANFNFLPKWCGQSISYDYF